MKEKEAKDKNRREKGAYLGRLYIGDRVLVKNYTEHGGTGKLRSYWKNYIYKVVDCKGEDSLAFEA